MKLLLTLFSIILIQFSFGQVVTEVVNFDNYVDSNNNDYKEKFTCSGSCLTQITTNGITGGTLNLPNSQLSFGGSLYCSHYNNKIGSTTQTSICFKFDSTIINPNESNQAATIQIGSISPIFGFVRWGTWNNSMNLEIISSVSSSTNNPTIILKTLHWYKLELTTNTIGGAFGDEIFISNSIFDLGTDGMVSPAIVKIDTETIYDANFVKDTSLGVYISGSKWGGSDYLDNFTFQGIKSADSCNANSTGLNEVNATITTTIYPNPFGNALFFEFTFQERQDNSRIVISDVVGRELRTIPLNDQFDKITVNTSNLPTGILIATLYVNNRSLVSKKLIKVE